MGPGGHQPAHVGAGQQGRRSEFVEDAETPERFRAKLADYRGTGHDRGHLAAAAGHKDSQRAMDETFELINISPQVGDGFNRDYWARLERFTRELSGRSGGDVLVATGSCFSRRWRAAREKRARELEASTAADAGRRCADHGARGGHLEAHHALAEWTTTYWERLELVGVPTHFFKVILATSPETKAVAAAAFVLPNAPIPADTPLEKFAVPPGKIGGGVRLEFFSKRRPGRGEARGV